MGNRETVSWFISVDRVNHPLIVKLRDGVINRYLSNCPHKHFTFHDVLSELYDRDKEVKHVIDNLKQIDEKIPHSARKSWKSRLPSYLYKRPTFRKLKIPKLKFLWLKRMKFLIFMIL